MKSVSLSVRISPEDAEFLAGYKGDGITPSDKVRAVISEARRRFAKHETYGGALELAREQMVQPTGIVRQSEREQKIHSDLVQYVMDWLPEVFAFVSAAMDSQKQAGDKNDVSQKSDRILDEDSLFALEEGVIDRCCLLMEAILRFGLPAGGGLYDRTKFESRLSKTLALAEIVLSHHQK